MTFAPVQVSATDGPMPDTVEQFKAIRAQGGTTVDVVITHTDLVNDEELLELVELEVRELATQNGLSVDAMTRSQGV
ncbi:MAG: elongation factor Tu [Nocardioidaceae bacterium]|jgi:elongation factor Tu|nr:elongation factor Tu [Nocardioidaceae bacterium]